MVNQTAWWLSFAFFLVGFIGFTKHVFWTIKNYHHEDFLQHFQAATGGAVLAIGFMILGIGIKALFL